MARWKTHEKWCQILGVEKSICREVNRIIDRSPHDIEKLLLRMGWAEFFKLGRVTTGIYTTPDSPIHETGQLTTELAEITNRFGEEGIKATFNHVALDYIAEWIKLGYSKEEVREKLSEKELTDYVPYYEQVFDDIYRETKPSPAKIQRRKEFERLAKSGVYGVFVVNHSFLPPVPALLRIKSELKKGRSIYVKWGIDSYDAKRGRISRRLHEIEDLEELISEITGL